MDNFLIVCGIGYMVGILIGVVTLVVSYLLDKFKRFLREKKFMRSSSLLIKFVVFLMLILGLVGTTTIIIMTPAENMLSISLAVVWNILAIVYCAIV